MPRLAHGRPPSVTGKSRPVKRKPSKSRNLDAFAIAEQESSTKIRVRPSRLGEVEEEGPEKKLPGARDQDDSDRPAKRRRIHGQDSPTDEDDTNDDSDGQVWHLGVNDDDEDSDLDSDEAMGESDEERFEGFTFRGSTAKSTKRTHQATDSSATKGMEEIGLEEGSQEDSSDDGIGEDAVDLATALDMNEDSGEGQGQSQKQSKEAHKPQILIENEYSPEDYTSASEDELSSFSVSDDGDLIGSHTRLKSFVQGLEVLAPSVAHSKKSWPRETAGEPSDYGLASTQKLTIADLLSSVTDPSLRESLKMLHNSEQKGSKTSTSSIPGKLDPPLPKRQQDRLDREAAYEKSKETLSRWIDTVKQNRRAEHMSFPLQDPAALAALGTNQLMPISQSEAITPLESTIQSIMHESGLASKDDPSAEGKVQAFEELQEKRMPIEEVQIRRAELRKARDLMFREEIRARRINKIKSKAYRRVHRKERDKHAQEERAALAAAGVLDSDDEREKQERRRTEERMGARHKESRWAKGIKATGRAAWDEDVRTGVTDLARQDEELRKRIEGKEPNRSDEAATDSSDQESSDNVSVDEYDEVVGLNLKQKLGELEAADQVSNSESRLSSMPFMRKAESARRAANQVEIDQTRRVLAGEDGEDACEDENQIESGGRKRFGLGQQGLIGHAPGFDEKNEFEEPLSEDGLAPSEPAEEQALGRNEDALSKRAANGRKATVMKAMENKKEKPYESGENPWLSGPRNRKLEPTIDAPIISTKSVLDSSNASRVNIEKRQLKSKTRISLQSKVEDLTSSSDSSEDETEVRVAEHEQSSQRNEELVRMAFAGDDVFHAFEDEKKATMDEEGDQVVDISLPGWGSWTGAGISRKEQKRANSRKTSKTIKGVDPSKRQDAKLDRVIINEKRLKKNAKYLAPELPHPFESRQQYERSLRLPLGPEWTTKMTFQDATKPRVLVKQGVIRPMERPMA